MGVCCGIEMGKFEEVGNHIEHVTTQAGKLRNVRALLTNRWTHARSPRVRSNNFTMVPRVTPRYVEKSEGSWYGDSRFEST